MSEAARDFGGVVSGAPAQVVRPASAAEVAIAVGEAAGRGLRVAARGCGHSTYGQALCPGGVVLDMRGLAAVREVTPDRVVAEAGATWREVLAATLPHGRTPPVLTDYLDLTVGGTLSAGGIGGTSWRDGAQTDHVLELEVVTGTGEIVRCSPEMRPELFDAVRAGLGRCGVIVAATFALVGAPRRVVTGKASYGGVAELLAAQRRLAEEHAADDIAGQAKLAIAGQWRFEVTATGFDRDVPGEFAAEELEFLEFADRMRPDVAELVALGEWDRPHPWAVFFIPGQASAGFIETTLGAVGPGELGLSGVVLINPVRTRTPLLRMPEDAVHFGLLRTASPGGVAAAELVRSNREMYEKLRSAGGFRYPIDAVPTTGADWRQHYGPWWPDLVRAKGRYDPTGALGGPNVTGN